MGCSNPQANIKQSSLSAIKPNNAAASSYVPTGCYATVSDLDESRNGLDGCLQSFVFVAHQQEATDCKHCVHEYCYSVLFVHSISLVLMSLEDRDPKADGVGRLNLNAAVLMFSSFWSLSVLETHCSHTM